MKKFIFSAVALIAFSFAGMANTEKYKTQNSTEEVEIEKLGRDCFDYAIGFLDAYEELLGPISDAHGAQIMNEAYANCWLTENDLP